MKNGVMTLPRVVGPLVESPNHELVCCSAEKPTAPKLEPYPGGHSWEFESIFSQSLFFQYGEVCRTIMTVMEKWTRYGEMSTFELGSKNLFLRRLQLSCGQIRMAFFQINRVQWFHGGTSVALTRGQDYEWDMFIVKEARRGT